MRRPDSSGFSLIEVLVSLGLLATVLISVSSLFVAGRHQVKSGRTTTEALAVARSILEEIEGWGYRQTYIQLGLDGSATTYTVDTRANFFAAKWQALLDEKLADSFASIEIASTETGGSIPALVASRAIKVTVTVFWREGERNRDATLRLVRL